MTADPREMSTHRWRVTFLLEEDDEIREVFVRAASAEAAKAEAERRHPYEAEASSATVAYLAP